MGVNDVLDSIDKAKENIEIQEQIVQEETKDFIEKFFILERRILNELLVLINIIVLIATDNSMLWLAVILGSTLIYVLPKLNSYLEYKKEKETIDSIDLSLIGNSLEREDVMNKRSVYDILSEYVTNTFENSVLVYHNIKPGDIINTQLEDLLLKELLENMVSNISPIVRRKFELYVGDDQVDIIMGRLAFLTVSIYAANSKKEILSSKPLNTR